jgi:hypothetical protein
MGWMILKARFSRSGHKNNHWHPFCVKMSPANREAAVVYSALSRRPRGNAPHNQTDDGDREHITPTVFPTQASADLSSFWFGVSFKVSCLVEVSRISILSAYLPCLFDRTSWRTLYAKPWRMHKCRLITWSMCPLTVRSLNSRLCEWQKWVNPIPFSLNSAVW